MTWLVDHIENLCETKAKNYQQYVYFCETVLLSWLPIVDNETIKVEQDNVIVTLWFDIASTWWATQHKVEDLPRRTNVLAHRIYADPLLAGFAVSDVRAPLP